MPKSYMDSPLYQSMMAQALAPAGPAQQYPGQAIANALAQTARAYGANQYGEKLEERDTAKTQALADALRPDIGGEQPGIPGSGGTSNINDVYSKLLAGGNQDALNEFMPFFMEQALTPTDPIKLGVNQRLIDPSSNQELVGAANDPNKAFNPDGTPNTDYMDWRLRERAAGRPSTTVSVGQSEYGTIDPGYALTRTPEGDLQQYVIPGSKAERAIKKDEQARIAKGRTDAIQSRIVRQEIDSAIGLIEKRGDSVTGWGAFLAALPETDARRLENFLTTIRANVGFDRLQRMRDASPTGGALGQVSELENKLLQATAGALDAKDSQGLVRNLRRLKDIYAEMERLEEQVFGFAMKSEAQPQQPQPQQTEGWSIQRIE